MGGVANSSSEEGLCATFAGSPVFRVYAAWVGTANEVFMASVLTENPTIS